MSPATLAQSIQQFITASPTGVVIESGEVLFDLNDSRYAISTENDRCVVHFWSSERNCVRRVVDAKETNGKLSLTVARLGKTTATQISIVPDRHRRESNHSERRRRYDRTLERVLVRSFPDSRIVKLKSSLDLAHSFGPAYARGVLRQGKLSFAVVGVNGGEPQATINGALTEGILWLEYLRSQNSISSFVSGLKLFVPPLTSESLCNRLRCLNSQSINVEIYELNEKDGGCERVDTLARGLASPLTHCANQEGAEHRFAHAIGKMQEICLGCDVVILNPGTVSFRFHGLEFARAEIDGSAISPRVVVFSSPDHIPLSAENESLFREYVAKVRNSRTPSSMKPQDPLWRLAPQRWLESEVMRGLSTVVCSLNSRWCYSQVPEINVPDRRIIDLLCVDKNNRLAVLTLATDEDMHLPLKCLDHWATVYEHHRRGNLSKYGYFPGVELSPDPPLLYMVLPMLHIHPEFDTIVKYFSPEVRWELVAINAAWRYRLQVVFRKRHASTLTEPPPIYIL